MPMNPSASHQSLGQVSEVSEENWSWFPGRARNSSKEEAPDITLHIGSAPGELHAWIRPAAHVQLVAQGSSETQRRTPVYRSSTRPWY
jgi:hypothetical protein